MNLKLQHEYKAYSPDFKILDGIRGVAALYVVINHARGHMLIGGSERAAILPVADWALIEKIYYSFLQVTALGSEFVIVFFVLSGFSIAYSLRYGQNIVQFYLKRLIRLYPPYLLALVWAFMIFSILNVIAPYFNRDGMSVFNDSKTIIKNLLYLNGGNLIPQFWSLLYEVIFYIIVPIALIDKRIYYVISCLFFIIGNITPPEIFYDKYLLSFVCNYNFYFFIGVFLYFNFNYLNKFLVLRTKWLLILVLSILFVIAILVNYTTNNTKITFLLAAFASLIMICNFLHFKITNKLITWLGAMSYTMYITHFASIYLFYGFLVYMGWVSPSSKIEVWWIWPIAVIFAVTFSSLFYNLVEKKTKLLLVLIRKKNRIRV